MQRISVWIFSLAALVLMTGGAGHTQPISDVVEESRQPVSDWMRAVSEFAGDVHFNEGDVRNVIDHWEDFSSFGGVDEEVGAEDKEGGWGNEFPAFDQIVGIAEYRAWAEAINVDPEDWLRKSMRILAMIMGEQILANAAEAEEVLPEQMKMIEAQREQIGEEMYQQMKAAMEASSAMMQETIQAAETLPKPTDDERALLKKYRADLERVMSSEPEQSVEGDW
jgi:hypothetical protein